MALFLFLKIIIDMLYFIPALDYILMIIAILYFIVSIRRIKSINSTDGFAIAFMLLLCLTMLKNMTGFTNFVKMISGFMLYFIGRGYSNELCNIEKSVVNANKIVLFVNAALLFLGYGLITWGNANTFRGVYYYKTDLAFAMIYTICSFLFFKKQKKKMIIAEWLLILYMIFRSNCRMALMVILLVFVLWLLSIKENISNRRLNINIKIVALSLLVFGGSIFIVSWFSNLPIFSKYNFIGISFTSFSDLFNERNTQGRNVIWRYILDKYNNSDLFERLFGIDFVSDRWNTLESHNSYIKILFSTGITGLIVFLCFIASYVKKLNKVNDRSLFYYNVSILCTFLLQSISQSAIDFTQMTWLFLFFAGCSVSLSEKNMTNHLKNYEGEAEFENETYISE